MLGTKLIKAAAGSGAAEATDADFENTVLLLHGDGNQGATNFSNTGPTKYMAFTDNSDNNFPITVNGDAYGDNFSPFSVDEGYWSNAFDGSTYATVANNAAFGLSGDFTIEAWAYFNTISASTYSAIAGVWNGAGTYGWLLHVRAGDINFATGNSGSSSSNYIPSTTIVAGRWYHFAVTRSGNSIRIFQDGVQLGTTYTGSENMTGSAALQIGWNDDGNQQYLNGYISNLRIVKGTAVYTSNFTPSTSPLTNITNTSLLTCQSNRFLDNSSNGFTVTPTGIKSTPLTPFTVTPNTTDGSGYFDGSGDNLRLAGSSATAFGTEPFCVEAWIYPTSLYNYLTVISTRESNGAFASAWGLGIYGNGTFVAYGSANILIGSAGNIKTNEWQHVVFCRNSSNNTALFVNGVRIAYSASITTNYTLQKVGIGDHSVTNAEPFTGYISQARMVKGSSVYDPTQTTLTVPTAPVTAVSGTSLLTCQYQGSVRNVGFIDSSPYDHLITRVGNTTQGSFSPFSKPDGKWSAAHNGGWFNIPNTNNCFAFGSSDFCMEMFLYAQSAPTQQFIIDQRVNNNFNVNLMWFPTGLNHGDGTNIISNTGGFNVFTNYANRWVHLAITRNGNNWTYWANGVAVGTGTFSGAVNTGKFAVLSRWDGNYSWWQANVSNLRVTIGSPVYTAPFTPPTEPLNVITGTTFLAFRNNNFKDVGPNNVPITVNGSPRVSPFSPFPLTTAYDPAVNGGSGYFDGNGDYLSIPYSGGFELGSSDFTIEGWMHIASSAIPYPMPLISFRSDTNSHYGLSVSVNNGYLSTAMSTNGSSWALVSSSTDQVKAECWNHFAIVRSGSNIYAYTNGVRYTMSTTYSGNVYIRPDPVLIGRSGTSGNYQYQLTGYISGLRVAKTAVYTASSFTPPTAPPTAIANTSLLTNFTNAGVLDNTGFNNLETVGNAQIDTTVKKYGTGAMKFDGDGDYLVVPQSRDLEFPAGCNFTIEAWVRPTAYKTNGSLIVSNSNGGDAASIQWTNFGYGPTGLLFFGSRNFNSVTASSGAIQLNTWTHVAAVRVGSTLFLYANGIQVGSGTFSETAFPFNVGWTYRIAHFAYSNDQSRYVQGYIDDLRITKGIARYTSNFTPPDKALADIGE